MFGEYKKIGNWFKSRINGILINEVRDNIYEKFVDMESILEGD